MGPSEQKISALLITFNEAENIGAVLENIGFADEIIVVDSYSTDNTVPLAKKYPHVKIIQRTFINYTDQKSFALEQASHNWVLFLDADERVTPKLQKEILETVKIKNNPIAAYYFVRTFMFQDKVLRFSGWQSDKNYRLFQKNRVKFDLNRIVHETLEIDGQSATLKNKLLHYSYTHYEDYKNKMIKYGRMKAREEFRKGHRTRWYHYLFRPLYKFFNQYILRLGILDGKKGIIICYLNALGVYARYKELARLDR